MAERDAGPKRDRFHHGDLRRAALDAAVAAVEGGGPDALSFRDVAAAVGVNHRALYRHFADKDDLAIAVAAVGFDRLRLDIAMCMAADGATPTGMLRGYVGFAMESPGLYALMFGMRGADFLAHPVLAPAVRGVLDLCADAFRDPRDPPGFNPDLRDRVMLAWGAAHGLCDLWRRGALRARSPAEARSYILDLLAARLSPGQGSA